MHCIHQDKGDAPEISNLDLKFKIQRSPCNFQVQHCVLQKNAMKTIGIFILWCLLFVLCWPIALIALLLSPIVWLISIPFRLLGICIEATFSLIKAILFFPSRLLGGPTGR